MQQNWSVFIICLLQICCFFSKPQHLDYFQPSLGPASQDLFAKRFFNIGTYNRGLLRNVPQQTGSSKINEIYISNRFLPQYNSDLRPGLMDRINSDQFKRTIREGIARVNARRLKNSLEHHNQETLNRFVLNLNNFF